MDLSVMFFGADSLAEESAAAKYRDLVTIAQEADRLGFRAVWTPERHFQRFGGAFPAPAVLSAALAAQTERIEVRAGSVVLPLKHPLRTVEEWSVLDNLWGGRVGLSVATGWHPTDFVLAPDSFADRRENALAQVELIRRLWAGERAAFVDGLGESVEVRPGPRPLSPTLPLWLTSSGSPRTWEAAGRLRTNVLAAAPGQSRDELTSKIELYRKAFDAAPPQLGAPPQGTVTLMVHAYVDDDEPSVRRKVREPLKSYFKAYAQQLASSKVGAGDAAVAPLTDAQQDVMAEFAFERYLTFGSLLGTPERCRAALTDLHELGCDEVACLVDFGLSVEDVLASLRRLSEVHAGLGLGVGLGAGRGPADEESI